MELLKYGEDAELNEQYEIIFDIWMSERTPSEWLTALLCPIYKKGDRLQCDNHRG